VRVISVLLVNAVIHGREGRPHIKHGTTERWIHPNWKDGRKLSSHGYVLVYHPKHRSAKRGYVSEHRLVYETFHQCCLLRWGVVHHKDGNRQNNHISNLEGMTQAMHTRIHTTYYHLELRYTGRCKQCGSKHITRKRRRYDKPIVPFRCNDCFRKWAVPVHMVPSTLLAYRRKCIDFGKICQRCYSNDVRRGSSMKNKEQSFQCRNCKKYWSVKLERLIKQLQSLGLQDALDILRQKELLQCRF
jgi:hypothetical protein